MKARCVQCTMIHNTYVDVKYLRLWRLHVEKAFDPENKNNKNNKIVEL